MFIYHVTEKSKLDNILKNGIDFYPGNESWVNKRAKFRRILDRCGSTMKSDWVPRGGAVYFWTNEKDARRYSRVVNSPVILKVDAKNIDLYSLNNREIEYLYTMYLEDNSDSNMFSNSIDKLIRQIRKWSGSPETDMELWAQPPISRTYIKDTIEIN
jgi:hypothetical protein